MGHLLELLIELIEILEPYLLFTTIFIIPSSIAITAMPRFFFKPKITRYLFPVWYEFYEKKKATLERINAITQMAMCVILLVDLFGLAEFFVGKHSDKAEEHSAAMSAASREHALPLTGAEETGPQH